MKFKQFAFWFIIFTMITVVLPVLLQLFKPEYLIPGFWKLFVLFGLLTLLICVSCILGNRKSNSTGTQIFLIATVVKLLLCLFFVVIYLQYNPVNALHFVACFFYLYILNTVFEISTLLRNLRLQNQK